eukprot:325220-Prorocentrum_minimum.AAC.1
MIPDILFLSTCESWISTRNVLRSFEKASGSKSKSSNTLLTPVPEPPGPRYENGLLGPKAPGTGTVIRTH